MKNLKKVFSLIICAVFIIGFANAQSVKGTIKDAANNKPIEGVLVTSDVTGASVITDANGNFSLAATKAGTYQFLINGFKGKAALLTPGTDAAILLKADKSGNSDVVITAGRRPTRKLEATTSVEIINSKALKLIKPEGIAEAIANTPGVYVNTSQGRRGGIITRGFPDGGNPLGGLDYTAILIDGLPAFGSTGRVPEAGFGFDNNVERVEVVRGSAATLFGRASAAGAVNVISKTGGENIAGSVRFTNYNNVFGEVKKDFNYRVDWNLNGSLTKDKTVRFNLGGWMLKDNGFKNTGFNDEGYQIRGNIDTKLANGKGNVRVSFLNGDFVFQNLTDVPADMNTMQIAGGYKNYQTLQNFDAFYNLNYTIYGVGTGTAPSRRISPNGTDSITRNVRQQMEKNSYGKTLQVGTAINYNLGAGVTVENKFRFQNLKSGTKYSFALPAFYYNNTVLRLLLDGDANDEDLINELRFKKVVNGAKVKHTFTLGSYYSKTTLRPTTYSFTHTMNPSNKDTFKFAPLAPPFVTAPWSGSVAFPRGGITRRALYTESVSAVFVGDEMKINDKLTISAGARYDWVWIGMEETKRPFDSTLRRNVKHNDYSASLGFNYLITPTTALYGSINRSFRAPDYTAYTSLEWISFANRTLLRAPDGIKKNENIVSFELGYRTNIGDLSIDVAAFHTNINNRLASIFENGIVVSKPFGSNRIMGGEVSLSYSPSQVKGLSLRANTTYQSAVFTEFKIPVTTGGALGIVGAAALPTVDINGNLYGNSIITEPLGKYSINVKGNQLPGIPSLIFNGSAIYEYKYFGIDLSTNINANRYADATQVLKYKDLINTNAGIYAKLPVKGHPNQILKVGVQGKNISNNQVIQNIAGIQASDGALGQKQATPTFVSAIPGNTAPIWGQGYAQLPRRILAYISFDF